MSKRNKKEKFVSAQHKRVPKVQALSKRQQQLINSILGSPMTITTGYSGTGKTFVPAMLAADAFNRTRQRGGVDKIILTRPNVQSGRSLGFRPGDLNDKLLEWFAEIMTVLREALGTNTVDLALKRKDIELVPFETMRGRSFNNAFVLLDEAQNTTQHEMKMFTTRLGQGTTTVVNGDVRQSDLKENSGLSALVDITWDMDIPWIDFDEDDIVRSELCKEFIVRWMEYEER